MASSNNGVISILYSIFFVVLCQQPDETFQFTTFLQILVTVIFSFTFFFAKCWKQSMHIYLETTSVSFCAILANGILFLLAFTWIPSKYILGIKMQSSRIKWVPVGRKKWMLAIFVELIISNTVFCRSRYNSVLEQRTYIFYSKIHPAQWVHSR